MRFSNENRPTDLANVEYASNNLMENMSTSLPVLLYQLSISFLASFLKPYMTQVVLDDLSAQGGVLLLGLDINLLEIRRVKVVNMLPAIITVPLVTALLIPFGF